MDSQEIYLKSVNELCSDGEGNPQRFFVADYQRGFRWSPFQVTQLLEDILEFTKRANPQPTDFYCLQPIVLQDRKKQSFEVVDGQQRLTTLLLILRYFNERLAEGYKKSFFTIEYRTRPNLESYLDDPNEDMAAKNPDFFFLKQSIEAVKAWFAEKEDKVDEIKIAVLNNTKVIWFQLADSDNPVDAFTRLNVGKIPLTNDELIRALFLRRSKDNGTETQNIQFRIAYEWDLIEKALQSDAFWYFLSNERGKKQNRIGFLFNLVAQEEGVPPEAANDAHGIFYVFSRKLMTQEPHQEKEWRKVKEAFLMLEEWFMDRNLYHMIGFLVADGVKINKLRKFAEKSSKSEFEYQILKEIFKKVIKDPVPESMDEQIILELIEEKVENLAYHRNSKGIRLLLLLFNLSTLLEDERSNIRFQFDSFKSELWDIEHVCSVASDKPERISDRNDWLEKCFRYLKYQSKESAKELRKNIEEYLELASPETEFEVFDDLYDKVLSHFDENREEEGDHGIGNLVLLDAHTNRSYKNAVFAVKRQRLLELDKAGVFVPICTRNVFLKCYSPHVDNVMFWGTEDREAYKKAIIDTLVHFFTKIRGGIK